jgi:hypothetical protein
MAFSVALKAKGTLVPVEKNDPHWTNWPTSIPYKWAHLQVTTDTTSYATGGLALNVLGQLSDWRAIVSDVSSMFTMNSTLSTAKLVAPNDGTPGNRLVAIFTQAGTTAGAEHAVSACSATTFDLWVTGY